jgi:acyl-CoA thioesterase-1
VGFLSLARRILLLSVIGFLLFACERGGDYSSVRNLDSPGKNVIAFGDSLTEGVGARRGEDYPSLLARELQRPVINAGRRGDTTAQGLARLERDVLKRNPRLVIVMFGGNDYLRRVPLSNASKNLEEIVMRIQQQGAMVVLLGIKLGLFTDEYGPVYKKLAKQYDALLIPRVLKGILSDRKLKSDSIHPNGAGYRLMAERILKQVRPLLHEADRRRER